MAILNVIQLKVKIAVATFCPTLFGGKFTFFTVTSGHTDPEKYILDVLFPQKAAHSIACRIPTPLGAPRVKENGLNLFANKIV